MIVVQNRRHGTSTAIQPHHPRGPAVQFPSLRAAAADGFERSLAREKRPGHPGFFLAG